MLRFYKRCGCASDTFVYNSTYCPGPALPSCLTINSTNTTNTTNNTNITTNTTTNNTTNTTTNTTTNITTNITTNNTTNTKTNTTSNNITNDTTNSTTNSTTNTTNTNTTTNTTANITDPSNSTTNSTDSNLTDVNATNSTDPGNMTNSTNSTLAPEDSVPLDEFFNSFFNIDELPTIPGEFTAGAYPGQECNSLVVKVNLAAGTCEAYLRWQEYIRVFHDKLLQTGVFCDPATPSAIFVNLTIQDDLTDPWSIAVVVPNPDLLYLDTFPSLQNWRTMFTKIYAVYSSPRLPALYSPDECVRAKPIRNLLVSAFALAALVTLVGIGSAKIVGLELFGILQLAYFTLPSHGSLDIYL